MALDLAALKTYLITLRGKIDRTLELIETYEDSVSPTIASLDRELNTIERYIESGHMSLEFGGKLIDEKEFLIGRVRDSAFFNLKKSGEFKYLLTELEALTDSIGMYQQDTEALFGGEFSKNVVAASLHGIEIVEESIKMMYRNDYDFYDLMLRSVRHALSSTKTAEESNAILDEIEGLNDEAFDKKWRSRLSRKDRFKDY